jgi:REP element-mobilizing transposase RayT
MVHARSHRQLDRRDRAIVLRAIREVCEHRGWILEACPVRTTHVHVVVTSAASPAKVMNDFNASSSRGLNNLGRQHDRNWARHGRRPELLPRLR